MNEKYLSPYADRMKTHSIIVEVQLKMGKMVGELQKVEVENDIYYVNDCKFWLESNKFVTIQQIEKGNDKMTKIKNVLANGVNVYELEVGNDYQEAQSILDMADVTENFHASDCYEYRVGEKSFLGTYEINVVRKDDYSRFIELIEQQSCYWKNIDEERQKWYDGKMTYDVFQEKSVELSNCSCNVCRFDHPSFEEWKSGKIVERKWNEHVEKYVEREIKLGKALKKAGFEQSVIDFYSTQIKVERPIFFTVSDRVQHIAGMSNYAEADSWNGYGGTSCQDTRHDGSECVALAGALHDDKLYIGMLHDELSNVQDMQDELKARVLFRLVEIDGIEHLIPTRYYGNNETVNMLHEGLKQLEEAKIYTTDIIEYGGGNNLKWHYEKANGGYVGRVESTILVYQEVDEDIDVTVDCPACSGSGEIGTYDNNDNYHEVECPMCSGSGDYETSVNVCDTIEEYVTVVNESEEILPYDGEGYDHLNNRVRVHLNMEMLHESNLKYGRVKEEVKEQEEPVLSVAIEVLEEDEDEDDLTLDELLELVEDEKEDDLIENDNFDDLDDLITDDTIINEYQERMDRKERIKRYNEIINNLNPLCNNIFTLLGTNDNCSEESIANMKEYYEQQSALNCPF